jgi:hypothetical protein
MSSTVGTPGTQDGPPLAVAPSGEPDAVVDGTYEEYERGSGWLFFAGTMIGLAGLFSNPR